MSVPVDQLRALLKELVIESLRGIDWSDAGFSADEEARFNRLKPNFRRDISLVAIVDPTTDPMNLGAGIGNVGVLDSSGTRVDPKTDDPIVKIAGISEIGMTLAKKTSPVFKSLIGRITGTNTTMTMEDPVGTDYQVPTGKVFYALKLVRMSTVANLWVVLGYADDAFAEGTTAPTNPVRLSGGQSAESPYVATAANTRYEDDVYFSIPAAKYPFFEKSATSGTETIIVYGVEVTV